MNPQLEHPTHEYDCQPPATGDVLDRGIVVSDSIDTLPSSKKSVAKSKRKEKEVILGVVLETEVLQRIITSFRVSKPTQPPLIPICRLVSHDSVKTVKENISPLGVHFRDYGYVEECRKVLIILPQRTRCKFE
ncbi:hypothetical protein O6H91_11G107700 [Diphasiastrum complanatum]|uniref:Uncharacterized protein n=1 Tax=Diphasiastrum complanatum TaxID=34168 RepID=A0ACC2CD23_DIPCM|nr:hypothetical protein O6H91_11G107700 [Diphasiastrum complanatum]